MPNWVRTVINIQSRNRNSIKQIFDYTKSEKSVFDFNKIIPMPSNIYRGNLGNKEREMYGENNWYDWCTSNWGTKWNACDAELTENGFVFDTAWSCPHKVIEQLSKTFTSVTIDYAWSDEDIGSNCGRRTLCNATDIKVTIPDSCTKQAYDIVFYVKPELKELYTYVPEYRTYDRK